MAKAVELDFLLMQILPRKNMVVSVDRLEESLLFEKPMDRWKEEPTAALHEVEDLL